MSLMEQVKAQLGECVEKLNEAQAQSRAAYEAVQEAETMFLAAVGGDGSSDATRAFGLIQQVQESLQHGGTLMVSAGENISNYADAL